MKKFINQYATKPQAYLPLSIQQPLTLLNRFAYNTISTKINESNKESLGINSSIKIPVSEGMIKYLKRHRAKFYIFEKKLL